MLETPRNTISNTHHPNHIYYEYVSAGMLSSNYTFIVDFPSISRDVIGFLNHYFYLS